MSSEVLSLLPGVLIGLALSAGWHWARERREGRSREAERLLRHLTDSERELRRAMALREALALCAGDEGEWWRPAHDLAAGVRDAALVCGDPALARLPDPVPVQEVVHAAVRARAALRDEVLPPPAPPPAGLVLVQRSAGGPAARAPRG